MATSHRNNSNSDFTNLYVKNFGPETTESHLCQLFSTFGLITSCKIQTDSTGASRGFGYVNYEKAYMARNAIEKLNGYQLDNGKKLYVGPFQNKSQRVKQLQRFHHENVRAKTAKCCLYISNLDTQIDENCLKEIFDKFGTVTKAEILRNGTKSKGIGLVYFTTAEETASALNEMNGKWILSKPIYIKLSGKSESGEASISDASIPVSKLTSSLTSLSIAPQHNAVNPLMVTNHIYYSVPSNMAPYARFPMPTYQMPVPFPYMPVQPTMKLPVQFISPIETTPTIENSPKHQKYQYERVFSEDEL